jgi:hypothetical protein
MIQNVVTRLGESPLFGALSVCLFFVVFAGVLLYAAAQKKSLCNKMSSLPLEDGERAKGNSNEQ